MRRGSGSLGRLALAGAAVSLGVAVFAFYFGVYRVRRFQMPVGFDTSWYVWRANFVGDLGLGPVGTSSRPGHALLSSVVASVTGLSQLQLAVVMPLVLVAVFALAVGGFASAGLGVRGLQWAATIVVAGTLLGTTRLVGENVATLLLLALAIAALASLAQWVAGGGGLWGAVALLVAAGVAHWMFLAVIGAVLAVAAALALPASRRDQQLGRPLARTQTGALTVAGMSAGLLMVAIIVGILRAPFKTYEIREDPARFLPKLRTDLSRAVPPLTGSAAALGTAALLAGAEGRHQRSFALRLLAAWAAVATAGLLYGVATRKVPPHRFLELLIAVPAVIAVAAAVWWLGDRARGPHPGTYAVAARVAGTCVALAVVSLPGTLAWYRHGPGVWLDPAALRQAQSASGYVRTLPVGTQFVFVVGPLGPAGLVSIPLKERTIRAGLPADRQVDMHLFAGKPADAIAGQRTLVNGPIDHEIQPYWEDVRTILPVHPPTIVLQALGSKEFDSAVAIGGLVLAPGVAVLQGPPIPEPLAAQRAPRPVPRTALGLVWGVALLVLLGVAGLGWARVVLGRGPPPEVYWSLAPAVGAGSLILGGLLAAKVGVRLAGWGGVVTYVVVALGGIVVALWLRRGEEAAS